MKLACCLSFIIMLTIAAPALAQDDDVEAREAEMFGAPVVVNEDVDEAKDEAKDEAGGSEDREAQIFGTPTHITDAQITQRLADFSDPLTVGGRLHMRLSNTFNRTEVPEGQPAAATLSSPALIDVFLDARPNDRMRGYAQGRLSHDFTASPDAVNPLTGRPIEQNRATLDQLWVRFDVGRTLYVTAGRQHLRWGTGRFWNPTDFLYAQRRDPLALVDERGGTSLLKLHLPVESLNWNFYAVANFEQVGAADEIGAAARAEFLFGLTEVALSAAIRKDQPLQLGASVSTALGPLDVHAEAALLHGVREPGWQGPFSMDPGAPVLPTEFSREDDWIVQVSTGAELGIRYSDTGTLFLGAEYFFNDAGYESPDLYPWLLLQSQFRPFYLGRHYAGAYAALPNPGSLTNTTFTLSALTNLSDRSLLTRLDYSVRVLTHLRAQAWASLHAGEPGEFRFGLEVPPVAFIPGLENGFVVPEPLFNVGVGLTMNF